MILVETEKATDLETKIEFSGNYGFGFNQSHLPVLGVADYKNYDSNVAKSKYPDMGDVLNSFPYLVDDPTYFYKYLYNNNTDWQDLIYHPAFTTNNILKVKGGDAIAKYNFSVGYLNTQGQVKNTGLSRYSIRLNSDVNLSKKISLSADLAVVNSQNNLMEQGMILETNPLLAALRKSPLLSPYEKDVDNNTSPDFAKIYDESGNIIENNSVSNPLALVSTMTAANKSNDVKFSGGLNYNLNNDLKLVGLVGLNYNFIRENVFIPGVTDQTIMPEDNEMAKNISRAGVGETFNMFYRVNAVYNKRINLIHNFAAIAGIQAATTKMEFDAGQGRNTASDYYKTLNYVNTSGRSFYGYNDVWNWANAFVNIQYTYNHQYAAGVNATFDGSSASGNDASRFKVFPSFNLTWYGKNSPFIKDIKLINNLNLRVEYAITGNSRFSSMLSKYHYVSSPYRVLSGIVLASVPNTKLTSETQSTIDGGIDLTLFNYRVNFTFDYYIGKVNNMILPKKVSSAFGNDYFYDNLATVQNSGFEAGLQVFLLQNHNLTWQIGATIAANKNKVIDLGGQENIIAELQDGSAIITQKDFSVYSYYGYKTMGVFSTDAEAQAAGLKNYAGNSFGAGDIHFVDKNSDGKITQEDRYILGNANPDFFGNVFTTAQYRRLELSATFGYSIGNKAYNAVRRQLENGSDFGNQLISSIRRWTYEGQVTDMPRATYDDPMGNNRFSDRFIEDASYLKLKEVILTYSFKFLKGASVYVSGENLFTITNYLGADPEFMYSYDPSLLGFDYAKIPLARTFRLGFKLKF